MELDENFHIILWNLYNFSILYYGNISFFSYYIMDIPYREISQRKNID